MTYSVTEMERKGKLVPRTLTPLHEAIRNTSSSIYNDRDRNHNRYR